MGKASGVSVGNGVSVGVSVGGRGVLVGIAAWVCATIVNAAATAVFCTSTAFMVGGGGSAPQALMSTEAATRTVTIEKCFMLCECLLMKLAIGVTSAPGFDAVIFYNDGPVALCDAETAECFEILFACDKCPGAIIPDRSREAVAGNDQIPALPQICHHIHR